MTDALRCSIRIVEGKAQVAHQRRIFDRGSDMHEPGDDVGLMVKPVSRLCLVIFGGELSLITEGKC